MKLSSHAQNTLAAVSFRCCNLGLENSYEETSCSWMWNFSSALWKYLLKGRNWSLMVNSLSQTMQAHTSQRVFIYPCYYLERIVLRMPLPPEVHGFSIVLKYMNLYQNFLCMSAVDCFFCIYLCPRKSNDHLTLELHQLFCVMCHSYLF